MKNRGSVPAILAVFTIFLILIVSSLAIMTRFQHTTTAGCTVDVNNTVHNCTLTDENYWAIRQTQEDTAKGLQFNGYLAYLLMGAAGIAAIVSIAYAARG